MTTVTDPRRTAAALLELLRRRGKRGATREEMSRVVGSSYGLLLAALEHDDHVIRREQARFGPRARRGEWWRVVLVREAPPATVAVEPEPEQLALGVAGTAPPRSAVLGLEDPS